MESELFSKRRKEPVQQQQYQESGNGGGTVLLQRQNREEEYAMAQRAAVEATFVGRETLETALRQGEQLQRAEDLATETEYSLDKATRVLRGMTWAGWWANKFSRDIQPPGYYRSTNTEKDGDVPLVRPPRIYDNVPELGMSAAQAVQNYNANLFILESCETSEQKETCQGICDDMYHHARREVTKLQQRRLRQPQDGIFGSTTSSSSSATSAAMTANEKVLQTLSIQLGNDLNTLHEFHSRAMDQRGSSSTATGPTSSHSKDRSTLLLDGGRRGEEASRKPNNNDPNFQIALQQDDHLDFMSKHLNELGSLASNLNTSLTQHRETLENLDEKSDSMLYKSKMVTRRTDQMIQKKSWTKPKKEFLYEASIRHLATGRYLACTPNNGLTLTTQLNDACIFGIWQRQTASQVLGLQSKSSRRWMGQNLLGNLVCSAYSFDRREEWDVDQQPNADGSGWSKTPLLCASGGWGNGAYLLYQKDKDQLTLGSNGLQDKKIADLWHIESYGGGPRR